MLAVDVINWGLETYGNSKVKEDIRLVREHTDIFQYQVLPLVMSAIQSGLIPSEYLNMQDISGIANVVLTGRDLTNNPAIKDISISILQNAGMYNQPMKLINAAPNSEGSDATRMVKPVMVPDYNKK